MLVPFDYQQKLTGILHAWLGKCNDLHGDLSLYSFSWLSDGNASAEGLNFPKGAKWFISFADEKRIKTIIKTILSHNEMFCGMSVSDITIEETPDLSERELFYLGSPVFIKRADNESNGYNQYTYNDECANDFMKETLLHKMKQAGMAEDDTLDVSFDLSYKNKKTKLMRYKNINNKCNMCPVIIKGKPETKAFVWNVGLGNSTGIGFGSIY